MSSLKLSGPLKNAGPGGILLLSPSTSRLVAIQNPTYRRNTRFRRIQSFSATLRQFRYGASDNGHTEVRVRFSAVLRENHENWKINGVRHLYVFVQRERTMTRHEKPTRIVMHARNLK